MRFYTSGFLSKWGFQDGDILDDLLYDNGFFDRDDIDFDHRVLTRVLGQHVAPKVEQKMKLKLLSTIHNPVRAATVDGVAIDHYGITDQVTLTPEFVEVDDGVILAIAGEERRS